MACHSFSSALLVLVVWIIGFGIITAYVAVLTALDNRAARKEAADAPGGKADTQNRQLHR